jgi:hypothetical protein
MALGQEGESYIELKVLQISNFWEQEPQQRQEILLVDVALDILAHHIVDVTDRHDVSSLRV